MVKQSLFNRKTLFLFYLVHSLARRHDLRLLLRHVCVLAERGAPAGHFVVPAQLKRPRLQPSPRNDPTARVQTHTPVSNLRHSVRLFDHPHLLAPDSNNQIILGEFQVANPSVQHVAAERDLIERVVH